MVTLDPRLAPNVRIYLNKLLDLPRTPLRTWSTAWAYFLALGGTVLLITSLMYLITVGKPGSSSTARGGLAYRTYLQDTEWQGYVQTQFGVQIALCY